MSEILKHSFDAVSLLTTSNGMLEVTVIPADDQPDWLLPSSLLLDMADYPEPTWTYYWQRKQLPVYHLFASPNTPVKILVLEGNTINHRIALQTPGKPYEIRVRITDVKDIAMPAHHTAPVSSQPPMALHTTIVPKETTSYLFQAVMIAGKKYVIPDLDKLVHELISA